MTQTETKHYQCRHIFNDGHRCGSNCLRKEDFCYYHHTTRRPAQPANLFRDANSSFTIPIPEDRSAIQAGIGIILQRIAQGQLDPRRAGLMLYGLQIAAANIPKPTLRKFESVHDMIDDPTLGPIAPIEQLDSSFADSLQKVIQRGIAQEALSSSSIPTAFQSGKPTESCFPVRPGSQPELENTAISVSTQAATNTQSTKSHTVTKGTTSKECTEGAPTTGPGHHPGDQPTQDPRAEGPA